MARVYKKIKRYSSVKPVKRRRKRKSNHKTLFVSIFGFLVFVLLGGFGFNYLNSNVKNEEIKVMGMADNNFVKEDELKEAIDGTFKFSYSLMGFKIQADNFLLSDQKKIDSLLKKFPQLEDIDITKDSATGEIVLSVKEKEPSFIWCEDKKCMLTDSTGLYAKDYNNEEKYQNLPRIEKKEWGDGEKYRKMIVGYVDQINKTISGIDYFKKQLYSAYAGKLVLVGEGKCEFVFGFNKDDINFEWQLEKIKTLLNREEYLNNLSNYNSITVRYGNQAIIK